MPPRHTITIGLVLVISMAGSAQAQYPPGDMNCDNTVNALDVGPLVLALTDPAGYQAAFPNCDLTNADLDCDGTMGGLDIPLFVDCVLNSNCDYCTPMVFVPGGEFEMGDSFGEGYADELPVHTVYLSPYSIDTYEVTNQQYANGLNWAWVQGGLIEVTDGLVYTAGGTEPYCDTTTSSSYSRITWDGGTFGVVAGNENHPIVKVSWYGSVAFCNWRSAAEGKPLCYDLSTWTCSFGLAGYRLPTEAEWEKAAGWDPVQQRHFRFGEHTDGCGPTCLDGQRANYWSSGDPYEGIWPPVPETTPVGYYDGSNHGGYQTQNAQSYYGCYDMTGNVHELCYDLYASTYYSVSPPSNPTGPETGIYRVVRDGDWAGFPHGCRSTVRGAVAPDFRSVYNGFRCAFGTP